MGELRHVFCGTFALEGAGLGDRGDLASAGSEIDAEINGVTLHHFTQAWTGSLLEISPRLTAPAIVHR